MFAALNYSEHLLIFVPAVRGCVSFSAFASLVGAPVGIASSTVELKNCALTAKIKKYNSINKEKSKKFDKIVLLAKPKLNIIKVLISKASIDSYIHTEKLC